MKQLHTANEIKGNFLPSSCDRPSTCSWSTSPYLTSESVWLGILFHSWQRSTVAGISTTTSVLDTPSSCPFSVSKWETIYVFFFFCYDGRSHFLWFQCPFHFLWFKGPSHFLWSEGRSSILWLEVCFRFLWLEVPIRFHWFKGSSQFLWLEVPSRFPWFEVPSHFLWFDVPTHFL